MARDHVRGGDQVVADLTGRAEDDGATAIAAAVRSGLVDPAHHRRACCRAMLAG
jgi:hypothetical protein